MQTINGRLGRRFAGGIYAAPMHRPNAVAAKNGIVGQTGAAGVNARPARRVYSANSGVER